MEKVASNGNVLCMMMPSPNCSIEAAAAAAVIEPIH
jgi:hypothetical protein